MTSDKNSASAGKLLLLMLLPVLLYVSANLLRDVQGPYYLFFYDPSYVYLINSLNLAQMNGYGVGHFDHPGTTVQVIGAVIVKLNHLFTSVEPDMAKDVLARPEVYLVLMNKVFVALNCLLLFALGIFIYRISGSLLAALLLQLSPYISTEIFFGLIIVTPENFLIFVCLLFIGAVAHYYFRADTARELPLIYAAVFALICALGLATKISFFPLLVMPLMILTGYRQKALFAGLTAVFFFVLILPGVSNLGYFADWVSGLALKSGKYGKGEATVINSKAFYQNVIRIFAVDKVFTAAFILSVIALVISSGTKSGKGSAEHKRKKIIMSFVLIFVFQVVIVAKHYAQYYMIPSFMLSVPALLVSLTVIAEKALAPPNRRKTGYVLGAAGAIVFAWSLYQIIFSYREGNSQRIDALKMMNMIEEERVESLFISSYGSSGSETALAFASQYGASQSQRYREILLSRSRSKIFYNQWTDMFFTLNDPSQMKDTFLKSRKILLQLSHYGSMQNFVSSMEKVIPGAKISYEPLFTNEKKETLYKISIDKE